MKDGLTNAQNALSQYVGRTQGAGDQLNQLAMDGRSLAKLKLQAGQSASADADTQASTLKSSAQQFEALFVNMLTQGMRQSNNAAFKSGLFDSSAQDTFTGMLDQQMAQRLVAAPRGTVAGKSLTGIGLADMMVKQLSQSQQLQSQQAQSQLSAPDLGKQHHIQQLQQTIQQLQQQLDVLQSSASGMSAGSSTPNDSIHNYATLNQRLNPTKPLANLDAPSRSADNFLAPLSTLEKIRRDQAFGVTGSSVKTKLVPASLEGVAVQSPASTISPTSIKSSQDSSSIPASIRQFVDKLMPDAQRAAEITGIPARFILAQAGLETGWGQSEIKRADGTSSFNLFNIKATKSWQGERIAQSTTEFSPSQGGGDGAMIPQKQVASFRGYNSYAESFRDYANLLKNSPRYQAVTAAGQDAVQFATQLQRSGYATDPNYGDKILGAINLTSTLIASAR
jgi:flagellar protein FlgJ